jgi:hypothetical protein
MKKIIMIAVLIGIFAVGITIVVNHHLASAQTPTPEPNYVPGAKCKTCHIKIYKAHTETGHATAFENIKMAGEETNPLCLGCHSTGYGKPGGFTDATATPDLAGVNCQACHGPGGAHVEAPKEQKKQTIGRVNAETCVKCHKNHAGHPELGAKELPYLKNKVEKLQAKIQALEAKK